MAINRKSGGTNVTITTRKRMSGGVFVNLTFGRRRTGGVWVDLWTNNHTVSVPYLFDARANGSGAYGLPATVTSGIGPFTYLWQWVSGGVGMTLSNTTSATVTITASGTNVERSGTIRCTVVDTGNSSYSASGDNNVVIQFGTPA